MAKNAEARTWTIPLGLDAKRRSNWRDTTPPSQPGTPAVVRNSSTSYSLSWSPSSDNNAVVGYDIYLNSAFVTSVAGTTFNHNDAALASVFNLNYSILAFDALGNRSQPANISYNADVTPPTTPNFTSLTQVGAGTARLVWTASSDSGSGLAGYRIYRNSALLISTTNLTYDDTTVPTNTNVTYYVTAVDNAGNQSANSNSRIINIDTIAPTTPTLSATPFSSSIISLSASASDANSGLASYTFERQLGGGSWTVLATQASGSYDVTGLSPSTAYTFRVRATDNAGNVSAYSSTASATTLASSSWSIGDQAFVIGQSATIPFAPPANHGQPFTSTGTALPSGVTISGSNLVWSGTGSIGTTTGHVITATPSAEADWLARSTAAGVVFTERFDTLQIGPGPGGGRYYNGDYGQRGFRDTTGPRCSGTGSLRLEHRPNENNPNMTGRYARDTADGGALLPNFAPGQVFYVQMRYRIDTNWYNNIPTWAGMGHKLILLHQDNISCGQIELSLQHYTGWYSSRTVRMYTGCGTPNLFTNTTNPNAQTNPPLLVQQSWDINAGGPPWNREPNGYELAYGAANANGAFAPQANTWYTFDFRVQLPSSWGASNCRIEAWVTPAGSSTRGKFVSWIGAMYSNGEPTNFMNNLTLTGYFSNGATNAATTGSCWYDEVIVSTQPIALPTALPVSP